MALIWSSAGSACGAGSICSRQLSWTYLVWCPFLLPVVYCCADTPNHQKTERRRLYHNHGSSHSLHVLLVSWCQHWGIQIQYHNYAPMIESAKSAWSLPCSGYSNVFECGKLAVWMCACICSALFGNLRNFEAALRKLAVAKLRANFETAYAISKLRNENFCAN